MKTYELGIILDSLEYTYRHQWEQTRFLSYIVAQTQSTKQLKLSDILKFTWDKEEDDAKNNNNILTKQDVERLQSKMNDIIQKNKKEKECQKSQP